MPIATTQLRWLDVDASPMLARGESGCRPLATRIGRARLAADDLHAPAQEASQLASARAGQVESSGKFSDRAAHAALADVLGAPLSTWLRPEFEWYLCRGAFFHNDAHYCDVLFGVWYIDGPPMDVMFPRAQLRLATSPGDIIVFDPFEIHGVLRPGEQKWDAERHAACGWSAFAGFEITLARDVETLAGVKPVAECGVLSSATRISAATGAIG